VFGNVLAAILPDKKGIARYGSATVPMDEALAQVDMDLSKRPVLVYSVPLARMQVEDFDGGLIEHFFQAFVSQAGVTLHINLKYGKDPHHCFESVFKAFGRALHNATRPDPRVKGVLSTKGTL
jgi:imidazoleglycerol-phosphate dehydratase